MPGIATNLSSLSIPKRRDVQRWTALLVSTLAATSSPTFAASVSSGSVRGGSPQECDSGESPDVIVGELHDAIGLGAGANGVSAFAVGTFACNIGSCWLLWEGQTQRHPVIAQNMYRLKDGSFEQIGMSWVKHAYTALSYPLCQGGCQSTDGTRLGVHCADPYDAKLNGDPWSLGPRSEVNAATGAFPFPFGGPDCTGEAVCRVLQARNADLNPGFNAGALYFVEGQYVTADDAVAGNDDNNASYRRITIAGSDAYYDIVLVDTTQRMRPAIQAWQDYDAAVETVNLDVPGDGRLVVAGRAAPLGGGLWRYDFAIQNLNSDRSVMSFSVPIPAGARLVNVGFHDVDYHSGEPYSGTDWPAALTLGNLTWSTESFAANVNANALRWGTVYSFRFVTNSAPGGGTLGIGLFKPGDPVGGVGPFTEVVPLGPPDCNSNGMPDATDVAQGVSADCNGNALPDECDVGADLSPDCNADGTPDECQLVANDCNSNAIPDECEPDCNQNTIADACDIAGSVSGDCDSNGIPDECEPDCDSDGTIDECDIPVIIFFDNFETDQGWTVTSVAPVTGIWERADPVQTMSGLEIVQPGEDYPAGTGTLCYVTDGRGGPASAYDVDGGPTMLTSPTLDMSSGTPTLSYAYWLAGWNLSQADALSVLVSNDDGASWTPLVTHPALQLPHGWKMHSVRVDAAVTPTDAMRIRFSIADPTGTSYCEAVVDDVRLTVADCPPPCAPPAAAIVSACSVKQHASHGECCLSISGVTPNSTGEPRGGPALVVRVSLDQPLCPAAFTTNQSAVTLEKTTTALFPAWQPVTGFSLSADGGGDTLNLTFAPPLENATTYRMTLTPAVTSLPGQTIHLRHLLGDADSSGRVNAIDRSRVVSAWTGTPGFTCETDLNLDGATNASDRSMVISAWTGPFNSTP